MTEGSCHGDIGHVAANTADTAASVAENCIKYLDTVCSDHQRVL